VLSNKPIFHECEEVNCYVLATCVVFPIFINIISMKRKQTLTVEMNCEASGQFQKFSPTSLWEYLTNN